MSSEQLGGSERLTGAEKRALLLWVVLGIVGVLFAQKYFFRAFPEASVDFRVSRSEALKRAEAFAGSVGENISGYESAIIFSVDDDAKTYLEREIGLQQANQMMASQLNIWYWDVRFFKAEQKEEFHVRVNPAGEVVGYQHIVTEASAGATLDRETAQAKAQNFLTHDLGVDLNAWEYLPEEANSTQRPNRLDWTFTWEKRGFRAKDAPYRLGVTVDGARVDGAQQYLRVPEAWTDGYKRLRSANLFLNTVAIIPYLLLFGAALWVGITLTKRGETSWGAALKLGAVVAVLLFFMQLNGWPLDRWGYKTNTSYQSFVFQQIVSALAFGLGSALMISLVLPGAEPLYRALQPNKLRLSEVFTLRGLRSKEFFSSSVVGLSMAAAHIGFIVMFYIVAGHFGAWAPQDLSYQDSVNTAFPWISGVAIGLLAATSEEFLFRLFAIPFLLRITRSRILAVVIPAFCWSFLHSAYPQEPPYIRGIEIGLIGIVAGLVMLRWGIVTTLIWHYTVDASLVGLVLVRSNSMYFKISGVIVGAAAVAPLLFSAVSYISRGRFEADEDLLNRNAAAPAARLEEIALVGESAGVKRRYDALSPAVLGFLAVCVVAGGALAFRLQTPAIGSYLKMGADSKRALSLADEVMRKRHLDPNSFRHAVVFVDVTDAVNNEFLRERVGIGGVNEIYAHVVPGGLWSIRYFRDGQPEEYVVILRPNGALHSVHHVLAEAAAGASLSKEDAVALAEKYLRDEQRVDLGEWTLVESTSDKKPHRTDHALVWQLKNALDAGGDGASAAGEHAYARMSVVVLGDEVVNYRTFIKVPEDWRLKHTELTLGRTVLGYGFPALFFLALGLAALVIYLKNMRSEDARSIPWKRTTVWSLWGLAGFAMVFVFGNRLPAALNLYDTTNPLKFTYGALGVGILIMGAFYVSAVAAIFGMAWFYGRRAFGEERLPGWTRMPAKYYRDAFWIGLGGTAGILGIRQLMGMAFEHWPTMHRAVETSFGQNFDAILPTGSIVGGALSGSLLRTGVIVLIAAFVAAQIRQTWLRALLFICGVMAIAGMGGDWGNAADFAKQFLGEGLWLAVVVVGVRYVMRFNMLGCFLVAMCLSLLRGASDLVTQPYPVYFENGIAVLVAMIFLLGWPLIAWLTGGKADGASGDFAGDSGRASTTGESAATNLA